MLDLFKRLFHSEPAALLDESMWSPSGWSMAVAPAKTQPRIETRSHIPALSAHALSRVP